MTKSKVCILLSFVLGIGLTLAIGWRKEGRPRASKPATDIRDIPGVSEGEYVTLPKVENLQSEAVPLGESSDRYMLLVIFSSNCGGCERDTGFWKRLADEARSRGIPLYLLSTDNDADRVKVFKDTFGLVDMPVLFDRYGEASGNLKINFVPQYLLLTGTGQVLGRWSGLSHFNSKRERIQDPSQMFNVIE